MDFSKFEINFRPQNWVQKLNQKTGAAQALQIVLLRTCSSGFCGTAPAVKLCLNRCSWGKTSKRADVSFTSGMCSRRCCNLCGFKFDRSIDMMRCSPFGVARLPLKSWARKGFVQSAREQQKQARGSFKNRSAWAMKISPQGQ